jgi:hypothetical protein
VHKPARFSLALLCLLGLAALGSAGCEQPPNHLEGSIESNVSLDFDRTRLIRYTSLAMQLEYLKDIEDVQNPDIVCKVVFDTPEGGIVADEPIDILANNGKVERIVAASDTFPPLDVGFIEFAEGGNEEGPAVGEFHLTFDNGRTLNGWFETTLEDVDF